MTFPAGTRPKNHHLLGRPANNEPITGRASVPSQSDSVAFGVSGFHHQQREIPVSTITADPLFGFPGRLSDCEVVASQRQHPTDHPDVSQPGDSAGNIPKESISTAGKDVCHNPGSATNPTLVLESASSHSDDRHHMTTW